MSLVQDIPPETMIFDFNVDAICLTDPMFGPVNIPSFDTSVKIICLTSEKIFSKLIEISFNKLIPT